MDDRRTKPHIVGVRWCLSFTWYYVGDPANPLLAQCAFGRCDFSKDPAGDVKGAMNTASTDGRHFVTAPEP